MDRVEAMSLLLTVVDSGSLSAAGRRLNMPLATVSRRISDLEAHLKTRLLQRTSRRITLTDAGVGYVDACRRILDDIDAAERQATGEYSAPRGQLVITSAHVFGRLHVVPILAAFLAAYPDIDVRLLLSDGAVNLLESHVDVGVRMGPLADSSLRAIRVGAIRRVICASPAYLASRGTPQRPQDLTGHDCITFLGPVQPEVWEFPAGRENLAVPVRSRLVVNGAEAAVDAAIAGAGIVSIFTYQVAAAISAGRLVALPFFTDQVLIPVHLIYALAGLLPLKVRAFLDYAAPRLRAALASADAMCTDCGNGPGVSAQGP
jgi:DNA-binding transcriptional LysR family regulator